MPRPILRKTVRPCVWMSAGLVSYKLCDRDFDCEHCPLDAALRGEPRGSQGFQGSHGWGGRLSGSVAFPLRTPPSFPDSHLYTSGHLCLHPSAGWDGGARRFYLSLDAFAAALLGRCHGVRTVAPGISVRVDERCSELDLGAGLLSLGAPLAGRVRAYNPALADTPEWVVTAPYGDGWLLELESEESVRWGNGGSPAGAAALLNAETAREQARLDLRHLRRRLALHWLTVSDEPPPSDPAGSVLDTLGPSLADGGVPLVDLRQMLGDRAWLALLRELVH